MNVHRLRLWNIPIQQEARASMSLHHLAQNHRAMKARHQDLQIRDLRLQDPRLLDRRDRLQTKALQASHQVKNLPNQMPPSSKLEEMNSSEDVFYRE